MTTNISDCSTPLVLIADDLSRVLQDWESILGEYGVEVVKATTIRELYEVFRAQCHEIAAIILDGCMPGSELNTTSFIRTARKAGFDCPIIAASGLRSYRDEMVRVGCSHQAPKELAAELAADLLSTP